MIGFGLKELVDQITVGAVDFDAIKSGDMCQLCRPAIILDDARNLRCLESSRNFMRLLSSWRMDVLFLDGNRRRATDGCPL